MENSAINPAHYQNSGLQTIEIIQAMGPDVIKGFCLGNVIKYVTRAGHKDPTKTAEDLAKADWYLQRYIEYLGGVQ